MNSRVSTASNTPATREHLLQEINAVAAETAALMKHAGETAGEQTDAVRASLEARFHDLQDRFHAVREVMGKQTRQAVQATDQYVHAHPWQSVGTVAAASLVLGTILGAWISRR